MIEQVVATITATIPVRQGSISAETPIRSLVRDSIDTVALIAALTEEYQLLFDLAALDRIETVGDIARYIEEHAGEGSEGDPLDAF